MSFSDHNLSVVRRRRCRCCKLFTFLSYSPEPTGQFQLNLTQSILGTNEEPLSFSRENNYEIAKIHRQNLKYSPPKPPGQFQPNLAQSILE